MSDTVLVAIIGAVASIAAVAISRFQTKKDIHGVQVTVDGRLDSLGKTIERLEDYIDSGATDKTGRQASQKPVA